VLRRAHCLLSCSIWLESPGCLPLDLVKEVSHGGEIRDYILQFIESAHSLIGGLPLNFSVDELFLAGS